MKLSPAQQAILRYLADGYAPFLAYYNGPPGSTRGAGFFWRQFDRKTAPPPVSARSVNGLINRDLLAYVGDGDYAITKLGLKILPQ